MARFRVPASHLLAGGPIMKPPLTSPMVLTRTTPQPAGGPFVVSAWAFAKPQVVPPADHDIGGVP